MQKVEAEITASQQALEESKVFKQQQEEYELLKRKVMEFPPRAETEAEIAKVKADTEELRREGLLLDRDLEVRLVSPIVCCLVPSGPVDGVLMEGCLKDRHAPSLLLPRRGRLQPDRDPSSGESSGCSQLVSRSLHCNMTVRLARTVLRLFSMESHPSHPSRHGSHIENITTDEHTNTPQNQHTRGMLLPSHGLSRCLRSACQPSHSVPMLDGLGGRVQLRRKQFAHLNMVLQDLHAAVRAPAAAEDGGATKMEID